MATCALVCLLALPMATNGNVITVISSADSGAGSLRQSVAGAADGDTIQFSTLLFGSAITLTSGQIIISKDLRITGLGDDSTTISGNAASRIFRIDTGAVVNLEKMTLTQGAVADSGGAIFNKGSLTMQYCTVDNNTAAFGGGIYNNGSLTISDCNFTDNVAGTGKGGGIYSQAGAFQTSNSDFTNNTSVSGGGAIASIGSCVCNYLSVAGNFSNKGGGIYGEGSLIINYSDIESNNANFGHGGGIYSTGNARLISCNVNGNHVNNAGFSGGGIYTETTFRLISSTVSNNASAGGSGGIHNMGTLTIISSTIHDNSASKGGGGIGNYAGALLNTSTVSGNTSVFGGGGIKNAGKTTLIRCTVAFNESDSSGGGFASFDSLLFNNTLIGNNMADGQGDEIFKVSGSVISQGHNLVRDISQAGFSPAAGDVLGTSSIPADPLLEPLQNNGGNTFTHVPRCGSPAIDAGDTTGAPSADQRDLPRIHGAGVDIGSVESQADPIELDAVITDVSAIGSTDGSIQVLVEGGTPPYYIDWNTGDSLYTITGLQAGNYSVTVEDFYGCTATAIFTVDEPNGVAPITNEIAVQVSPNPASTSAFIETPSAEIFFVKIFDLSGKMLRAVPVEPLRKNEGIQLSVQELPKGNYAIQLLGADGMLKARGRFTVAR